MACPRVLRPLCPAWVRLLFLLLARRGESKMWETHRHFEIKKKKVMIFKQEQQARTTKKITFFFEDASDLSRRSKKMIIFLFLAPFLLELVRIVSSPFKYVQEDGYLFVSFFFLTNGLVGGFFFPPFPFQAGLAHAILLASPTFFFSRKSWTLASSS